MIAHIEKLTDEAVKIKRPSLNGLIQKRRQMDYYKSTPKALLSTQKAQYDAVLNGLIEFFEDRIVEDVSMEYQHMFYVMGVAPGHIVDRIYNNTDAGFVDRDGTVMGWHRVDARLEAIVRGWITQRKAKGHASELKTFVADKQNIHTSIVNTQTRDTLSLLFAVPVSADQRTLSEIDDMWISMSLGSIAVYQDIRMWAGKSMIVEPDDFLYRKTLRALWAKIKTCAPDVQKELAKRLYEECRDSLGMCAQGHIARLANVFVGFDAAVKAPVSEKEIFQQKMADIGALDATTDAKIAAATRIMNEVGMGTDERQVWLEVF